MREVRQRRYEIDFLKFVASIMVVCLHSVEPGGQQFIYLMGSYGIPIFLLVNGYLLANKRMDFYFARHSFFRFLRFIILWVLIIGIPISLLKKRIVVHEILAGIFRGNSWLFHLWFLVALCIIYLIVCSINHFDDKLIPYITTHRYFLYGVSIIFTFVFALNLLIKSIYSLEIRDIIWPPFRLITNMGYFLVGMHLNKFPYYINKKILVFGGIAAVFATYYLSTFLEIMWASSMYSSLSVFVGTIAITLLVLQINFSGIGDKFKLLIETSTGVWIVHPFIVKVVNKLYRILFGEYINIAGRCAILFLTVGISLFVVLAVNSDKLLRKCFKL